MSKVLCKQCGSWNIDDLEPAAEDSPLCGTCKPRVYPIKLIIEVLGGHICIIGSQGTTVGSMTTNEINRLTLKKICKFMNFEVKKLENER